MVDISKPTESSISKTARTDPGYASLKSTFLHAVAQRAPTLIIALVVIIGIAILRHPITALMDRSTEIALGPVTLKAAEAKLSQVKTDKSNSDSNLFTDFQITTLTKRYEDALAGGRRAGILWVDDNPENNKLLVDFLDLIGVPVVIARSYSEAVDRLHERSFNAIVSDWSRPDDIVEQQAKTAGKQFWGSGAQLAELLTSSDCGRRVILFSSGSTDMMPIPPGVSSQTNNFYDLLMDIADLVSKPTPRCFLRT